MDREKVIKGLRDIDMFIAGRLEYEKAKNFLRTIDETIMLLKEQEHKDRMFRALEDDWKRLKELLKEQEAVEPEIHLGSLSIRHNEPELTVYCGACKGEMVHKYSEFPIEYMKKQYKYCHHCGQAVKWE